jgi:hypothetical protein
MLSITAPKDSYIELFMSLLKDQETPSEYDFWAAVWTIGAVVGRSCYIDRPRAPIYFNWYIVVCAESRMTRKSTVINFAYDMIQGCLPEYASTLQTKTTPEKLWALMSNQSGKYGKSHVVINISEMVTFFGKEGYSMGMPIMLTDLYDCPDRREGGGSLNYGTLPLVNPFITFIAGSTPSWLSRAINPDVIEGGFTSRTIFISSEQRKKLIFWPDRLQSPNKQAAKEYLNAIRDHAARIETIQPDEEAKAFLTKWYSSRQFNHESYLRSFESREDSHILRLAGTLALSQLKSNIGISEVELALYAISRAKKSGRQIFKQAVFDLKLTNGLDKIRETLLKRGLNGVKNHELQMSSKWFLSSLEYNSIMEILTDMGAVRQYTVPSRNGKGRPVKFFMATTKILNPQTWTEIKERSGMSNEAVDEPSVQQPEHPPVLPSPNSQVLIPRTSQQTSDQMEKSQHSSIDLHISYIGVDPKRLPS